MPGDGWSITPVNLQQRFQSTQGTDPIFLPIDGANCPSADVSTLGEIRFAQDGKDVRCRPGALLIERSHLPYEFSHGEPAALPGRGVAALASIAAAAGEDLL